MRLLYGSGFFVPLYAPTFATESRPWHKVTFYQLYKQQKDEKHF